jgi:ATP-dependent Lon protease
MADQPGGPAGFTIPDALPVLPLRDAVVFPLTAVPLAVGQARSLRLVDDVMRGNRLLALVAQREPKAEPAGPGDLYRVGTAGVIHQLARVPDGTVRLMVQGLERIRVLDWVGTEPYLVARIELAPDPVDDATEAEALRRAVVDIFRRLVAASAELADELAAAAENVADPRHVAYFVASVLPLDGAVRQQLLETEPLTAKLRRLVDVLQREVAVRELGRKITSDTEERLTKKQREFYLREQLRSIQRELGEEEEGSSQVAQLRRRVEEAGLPDEARSASWAGSRGSRRPRRSTAWSSRTWSGWRACPGAGSAAGPSTSTGPAGCWTRTTTTWRRSRSGSWSTWRSRSCGRSGRDGRTAPRRPPSRRG